MMIEEIIREREAEILKVSENSRLVALALGEHPNRATRIGNALETLFARLYEKIRDWSNLSRQKLPGH
jgi:hypothetical protein